MARPTVFPRRAAYVWATLVIFLHGVAPAALHAQRAGDNAGREESVRIAELARRDALLAADTVALSRLVATEFYEISRVGLVRPRAANMREIATGTLKLLTVNYDSTTVHLAAHAPACAK